MMIYLTVWLLPVFLSVLLPTCAHWNHLGFCLLGFLVSPSTVSAHGPCPTYATWKDMRTFYILKYLLQRGMEVSCGCIYMLLFTREMSDTFLKRT